MATTDDTRDEKSYLLAVQPIEYSLTEGTEIPPPPKTPERSSIEQPISRGGPLNSHPATDRIPGAYPDSESEKENIRQTPEAPSNRERADSFNTPQTPDTSSSPKMNRRPTGIRRLMSLSNLRSSFSSSRTSLSLPRESTTERPMTGVKRPSSPSFASSIAPSSVGAKPLLRSKRSGNWFKRKSSMFLMNHDGTLNAVAEDPDLHTTKRLKESAPTIPEISYLGGGSLSGGDLGWDSSVFRRDI